MTVYSSFIEAANAARDYIILNKNNFSAHLKQHLEPLVDGGTSPVVILVTFVEVAYANLEDLPVGMPDVAVGCALQAVEWNFHGMRQNDRGINIAKVLQDIEVEHRPEPKEEFVNVGTEDAGD